MSEYLVVTGMSGAGRSTAGATLEDLGWFVIDNMPSALISKVSELVDGTGLGARAGGPRGGSGRGRPRRRAPGRGRS